ncbi:MAG: CBS domain-containing protein [Desulfurococcales archaeon]|nr:CBS domain-containing protein [Desulfurococcales archaeon]
MSEEPSVDVVMSTPPILVGTTISVAEGARIMARENVGSLIIVDENDSLIGIVTKTDIVYKVVAEGRNPSTTMLGEIMTRNPYYIFRDASLREAAELMGDKRIGHLPVVDPETMKVVGVISKSDILRIAPHYIELVYVTGMARREPREE